MRLTIKDGLHFLFLYSIERYRSVWSNYKSAGRMWPATAYSVAGRSIQEKSAHMKVVKKCVRSHFSHWIFCAR